MSDFDFFSELGQLEGGAAVKGYVPRFETYEEQARFNFARMGKEQIELIESGEGKQNKQGRRSGNWFEELSDGRFKVTFKNGITAMELIAGRTYFVVKDATAACQLIAKAMVEAEKGSLDAQFVATKRKETKKEEKPTEVAKKYLKAA
jgi:hypothetical protein